MNSNQLRVYGASGTRALPLYRQPAQSTGYASLPSNRSSIRVMVLTELGNRDFVLRAPIPIRVSWSSDMNCYVAVDDVVHWFGQGDTPEAAQAELAEIIVEDYRQLREWPGTLSAPLQQRLTIMKRYIGDAC